MELYKDPILWYGESQITGDTIRAFSIENKIDSTVVMGNAMVLSKVDSIYEKEYNQIKRSFYVCYLFVMQRIILILFM